MDPFPPFCHQGVSPQPLKCHQGLTRGVISQSLALVFGVRDRGDLKAKANKPPSSSAPNAKPQHHPQWLSLYVHSRLEPGKVRPPLSLGLKPLSDVLSEAALPQGSLQFWERQAAMGTHIFAGEACWASGQFIKGGGERGGGGGRGGRQLCFGSEWVTGPLGPRKAASRGSGKAVRRPPRRPCRGPSS